VPAPHVDATLTARKLLFDNPDHADARISPDGKRIAWLAPVQGVMNVWVGAASDVSKGQAVTHDTSGGIRRWWWGFDNDRVVYARNVEGADAVHLWAVELTKGEPKDLTPIEGVRADLVMLSAKRPHEALISINDRDKKFSDVYLVDLARAGRKMAAHNDGGCAAWIGDEDLRVRFARRETADGATDYLQLGHGKEAPKEFLHVPLEDARTVEILGFDKSGDVVLLKDSRNRDTSALLSLDTKTLASTRIADDAAVDVGQVLVHPTTHVVEAVSYNRDRQSWSVVDASVEGDLY
jgi:hypothetical protein